MKLSDEFFQKWDHIISEVDKTEIPLECIKKVVVRLYDGRQRTINIAKYKKDGLDLNEIESMLSRILHELGDSVRDLDFVVDVNAVANLIQPVTDNLLRSLK